MRDAIRVENIIIAIIYFTHWDNKLNAAVKFSNIL